MKHKPVHYCRNFLQAGAYLMSMLPVGIISADLEAESSLVVKHFVVNIVVYRLGYWRVGYWLNPVVDLVEPVSRR